MEESAISLKNLEASLIEYQNAGNTEHSFKLSDVPIEIVAAEVTPAASSSRCVAVRGWIAEPLMGTADGNR